MHSSSLVRQHFSLVEESETFLTSGTKTTLQTYCTCAITSYLKFFVFHKVVLERLRDLGYGNSKVHIQYVSKQRFESSGYRCLDHNRKINTYYKLVSVSQ